MLSAIFVTSHSAGLALDDTHQLKLPYIIAAQAQKHVTHNEALRALDAIVQLSVLDRDLTASPAAPDEGDRYIVAATASGAWSGQENRIAAWQDGAWAFYVANEGWLVWVSDEDTLAVWSNGSWVDVAAGTASLNPTPLVGVNATADTTNRLAVSSPATLFNHAGSGHQQKINKNAVGDTASQLYQTNFSGRAEIGLTGDDDFHFKVSPDGTTFQEALTIDKDTGHVGVAGAEPNANGALDIDGAIRVKRETNAFGTTSVYTAFVMGQGQNGGLYAIGRGDDANEPFTGLCGWDSGADRRLYFGGGGWSVPDATSLGFYTAPTYTESNNTGLMRLEVTSSGTTRPGADNSYDLGSGSRRWREIYCVNGTINTSDEREKTNVAESRLGLNLINLLNPVSYKWRAGAPDIGDQKTGEECKSDSRPGQPHQCAGTRTHYGLIAQDVKAALDKVGCDDFAGWVLDDKANADSRQALRYTELIAPMIKAIQELSEQLTQMQCELQRLQQTQ